MQNPVDRNVYYRNIVIESLLLSKPPAALHLKRCLSTPIAWRGGTHVLIALFVTLCAFFSPSVLVFVHVHVCVHVAATLYTVIDKKIRFQLLRIYPAKNDRYTHILHARGHI